MCDHGMRAAINDDKSLSAIVIASLTAVIMATGCSGMTPTTRPASNILFQQSSVWTAMTNRVDLGTHPSWMKLAAGARSPGGYIYVGQFLAKTVNQYRTNNRENDGPVCEIPVEGFVTGISTDRSGNLYLTGDFKTAQGEQISGVAIFGPDCGSQGLTFSDPYGDPEDPVIDGQTLYLSSQDDVSLPGSIAVYNIKAGSQPQDELTDPAAGVGYGVALDSHHNLFWSNTNTWTFGGQVIEFPRGKMPGIVLKATRIGLDEPGGVILDKSNNLLLIDQNTDVISIYAPPYKLPPFSTITMRASAWYCAMGVDQTRLYCLDDVYGSVDAYTYPKGKYLFSYANGIEANQGPVGIAVQPLLSRRLAK